MPQTKRLPQTGQMLPSNWLPGASAIGSDLLKIAQERLISG